MDANQFTFGFRVAGAPHEPRRLVTWRKAFAAHCTCEGVDTHEAYLSAWQYGPELPAHMKASGGVAGFVGPTWADWIPIDIDGAGAEPVADALERVRRLLAWLEGATAADLGALSCWFSGGKGFHVLLPVTGLCAEPGPGFHSTARAFVAHIGQESGARPDLAIYDAVRILRAPNTRHAKTGLYKIPLRADELLNISADAVLRLAAEPCPGDVSEPGAWCDWEARDWWAKAQGAAAQDAARKPADDAGRVDLNRATLEFIRGGAMNGERERRCFMAAANLAEFGCDERLAAALLAATALDSGLTPNETKRAIAGGVKHGRGGAA